LILLTWISTISPSLIFLQATSSLGRVTTRDLPSLRTFTRLNTCHQQTSITHQHRQTSIPNL
jgi:hypothetical protein